jgi:N-methylhydantoinase A
VDAFLGGQGHLDRDAVRGPLEEIAQGLGGSADAAAEGVLAVADAAMERALRVISVERGYDPADFAVLAFGGAGALHVAELTRRLGAARALVPPDPGLLSAYGMLASPVTREVSRTVLLSTADARLDALMAEVFEELEAQARQEMLDEGADSASLAVELSVDARYQGQSFELRVDATDGWAGAFHTQHEERYGYQRPTTPVEAVTLRAVVTAPPATLDVPELPEAKGPPTLRAANVVYGGQRLESSRVWRHELAAGHVVDGPAVIQEYSATTWVPPEWRAEVDSWGCLHLLRVS